MRTLSVHVERGRIRRCFFRTRDNLAESPARRLILAVPLCDFGRQLISKARELLDALLNRSEMAS
jgi:hypothetical protein